MRSKCLRHIGTAASDLDDDAEHVARAAAGAAVAGGHPQAEQACVAQPLHRAVLQHAVPLGGSVVTAQLLDNCGQPGQPVRGRAGKRLFGKRGARPDHFKRHCCLLHLAKMRNDLVREPV
jgi:hypothetical protein